MNIQPSVPNLADYLASPANSGPALRLLAGEILDLQLGKNVQAVVKETNGNQATLSVQGKPVLVETSVRLEAGAELLLKVVSTGAQPRLEVQSRNTPTQTVAFKTASETQSPSQPQQSTIPATTNPSPPPASILTALEPGYQITATVAKAMPEGRVLLDVQGTLMEAAAPESFPAGTRL